MMMQQDLVPRSLIATTVICAHFLAVGCGILEVENPNNLLEEDLGDPGAAAAMVNGLEAAVTRALSYITAPYSVGTDECIWVGSRDAWGQLDAGVLDFPGNEFTDQAFPYVGEARWMADEFTKRLEEAGSDSQTLARAHLYRAIIYVTIADMFDDFVIGSDRREPAPAVGPMRMDILYDEALASINRALDQAPGGELNAALLGLKARTVHGKALWKKVNPVDTDNPLVDAASAEAAEALAAMEPDFRFSLETGAGFQLESYMAGQINERLEFTFSDRWVRRAPSGKMVESVTYPDMITGSVHPFLERFIAEFVEARQYADLPIVSAREMHLILAESALARQDLTAFRLHINGLRDLDGLDAYAGQVDARALLEESRSVNLFLQGRRLLDLYRFGRRAPEWEATASAVTAPGTFLPITQVEIEANPLVD